MKRFLSVILFCILMMSVLAPAFAANSMQEGSMYVTTPNGKTLHFRSSKSTKGDNILCEIPYGTKVYVIGWDGTWAKIQYNGATGYVVKKYLAIAQPESYETVKARQENQKAIQAALREAEKAQKAAEAAAKKAEAERLRELKKLNAKLDQSKVKTVDEYDVSVITEMEDVTVKLYTKPSLLAEVLAEYPEGTRLVVNAENGDWARVYNGATDDTGYILLADLEKDLVEDVLLEDE